MKNIYVNSPPAPPLVMPSMLLLLPIKSGGVRNTSLGVDDAETPPAGVSNFSTRGTGTMGVATVAGVGAFGFFIELKPPFRRPPRGGAGRALALVASLHIKKSITMSEVFSHKIKIKNKSFFTCTLLRRRRWWLRRRRRLGLRLRLWWLADGSHATTTLAVALIRHRREVVDFADIQVRDLYHHNSKAFKLK